MADTPNSREYWALDEKGSVVNVREVMTAMVLHDKDGNFIENLNIGDHESHEQVRWRMMQRLWDYYLEKGFSKNEIIPFIKEENKYFPHEADKFLLEKF